MLSQLWAKVCGPKIPQSVGSVVHSQSYPTLWDSMNCSPTRSSLHGIFQEEYCSGLLFSTPATDMFLLNALIKVGSGWWPDGTARFVC